MTSLRTRATTLRDYTAELVLFPQVLVNIPIKNGFDFRNSDDTKDAVAAAEAALASKGRVLLRPSGTEPLLRVMVEGEDRSQVLRLAEQIADAVRAAAAST